ncbi:MAG: adenine phosphoribosyltransferase [Candidatus Micrarchaeaceae archaeon]
MDKEKLMKLIKAYDDFPINGIRFLDISYLIANPAAMEYVSAIISESAKSVNADLLAGIEARGFVFAAYASCALKLGMAMIRKKGKLPGKTISEQYDTEYSKEAMEAKPEIFSGKNVFIIDDVLATGNTLLAASSLVEKSNGKVAGLFAIIEISRLNGREKLSKYPIFSILHF